MAACMAVPGTDAKMTSANSALSSPNRAGPKACDRIRLTAYPSSPAAKVAAATNPPWRHLTGSGAAACSHRQAPEHRPRQMAQHRT